MSLRSFPQSLSSSETSESTVKLQQTVERFQAPAVTLCSLLSHLFSSLTRRKSFSAHTSLPGVSRQPVTQRQPPLHADLDGRGHHDASSFVVFSVDPLVAAGGGRRAVSGHGGVVGVHHDASLRHHTTR